tara:strand:+ start:8 stop:466 length:459 start_codon:yes stop_codon:yes gene_type:complete
MKEKIKGNQINKILILALLIVGCGKIEPFNPSVEMEEDYQISYDYIIEDYIVSNKVFTIEGIIINTGMVSIPADTTNSTTWYLHANIYSDDTFTLKLGEFNGWNDTPIAPDDTVEFKIHSIPHNENVNTNTYYGGKKAEDYPDFRINHFHLH